MVTSARKCGSMALAVGVFLLSLAAEHVAGGAATAAHHVVGGDPGWDVGSDVLAWAADRLFTVGDTLWFAYEAADGGGVAEVGAEAEFESCKAGKPIRTYTDGLSSVGLDGAGTRYFVSADPAKCESGLKLRVDVRGPVAGPLLPADDGTAAPAPEPSASRGVRKVAQVSPFFKVAWFLLLGM